MFERPFKHEEAHLVNYIWHRIAKLTFSASQRVFVNTYWPATHVTMLEPASTHKPSKISNLSDILEHWFTVFQKALIIPFNSPIE